MQVVLPHPERPRASVLVLAWRQTDLLLHCLASLAAQRTAVPFETVIVLNGASDPVVEAVFQNVSGGHVVRSTVNLGVGGGCNLAATIARGEYLVLVNDDTVLEPDWLDNLVKTADDNPGAGAVGSRIRDPQGLLQEAGGIPWSDGSVWHFGRLLPIDSMEYLSLRVVDYCSACALLVRRSTWDAVGGFDEAYFPGYYEDLDLCLSIKELGQQILYQPAARLMHHGGGDAGSLDLDSKAFVSRRSRRHFMAKWETELRSQPAPPGPDASPEEAREIIERALQRARHRPIRALLVDSSLGGPRSAPRFERLLRASSELTEAGYAVGAWSPLQPAGHHDELGQLGVDVVEADLRAHLSRPSVMYDVVLVMTPADLWSSAQTVRSEQPQATLLCHVDDEPPAWVGRWADIVVTGVESHLPPLREDVPGFEARRDLLTVAPEREWLRWMVAEVMPEVTAAIPWARLVVAGHAPAELEGPSLALLRHAKDADVLYRNARAVVAEGPVHAAAALARGVPVVTAGDKDAGGTATELLVLLRNRQAWGRRAAAAAALPRSSDPRWCEVVDAARRARP